MKLSTRKIAAGVAALAGLALGGAAIANATSNGEQSDNGRSVTSAQAKQARAAALAATGGGTVNALEADSEQGATYEVEVRKPDGSTVDVRLDASYKVVAVDSDQETNDDQATSDGDGETNDDGPGAG